MPSFKRSRRGVPKSVPEHTEIVGFQAAVDGCQKHLFLLNQLSCYDGLYVYSRRCLAAEFQAVPNVKANSWLPDQPLL